MIFGLFGCPEMGIAGAAIATVIGQIAAMALSFFALFKAQNQLHLPRGGFRLEGKVSARSTMSACRPF